MQETMSKLLIHEPTFKEVVYGCHIPVTIVASQKAEITEDVLQMAYKSLKARHVNLSIRRNLLRHKERFLMVKNIF